MKRKTTTTESELDFVPTDTIEGDVRIIREDSRNFVVQQYRKVDKRDGSSSMEWITNGYYGERPESLVAAAKGALMTGCRGGEIRELIDTLNRTDKHLTENIKHLLGNAE
jgi:hypothetical protein